MPVGSDIGGCDRTASVAGGIGDSVGDHGLRRARGLLTLRLEVVVELARRGEEALAPGALLEEGRHCDGTAENNWGRSDSVRSYLYEGCPRVLPFPGAEVGLRGSLQSGGSLLDACLIELILSVGDLEKCVYRNDEKAQQQVVYSEEIDHGPLPLPEVDVR